MSNSKTTEQRNQFPENATITIDGVQVPVSSEDENIVLTAKKAGIGIPAPCFLAKRKGGCCKGCGIEVDGKKEYACAKKATPGMNIVVNREDLKADRKENLMKYKENLKAGITAKCEMEEQASSSSCGCSCGDSGENSEATAPQSCADTTSACDTNTSCGSTEVDIQASSATTREDGLEVADRYGISALKWHAPFMKGMGLVPEVDDKTIPMWVADMEFRVSPQIELALAKTALQGTFGYTLGSGNEEYLQASIGYYKRHYNWDVTPGDIAIATGTLAAIIASISAVTDKGDGIIVQQPVYSQFMSLIKGAGREVINNGLIENDGSFEINFEELEELASNPQTTMMILCNPHNPTGKVYSADELRRIADIMNRNGVVIFSDEVHAGILRNGVVHTPTALVAGDATVITAADLGKTFNISGMHITNIICSDSALRTQLQKEGIGGLPMTIAMVNPFSMSAAIAAYRDSDEWREKMNKTIDRNFSIVKEFLAERLPSVKFTIPEGTYFAWLNFEAYGLEPREVSRLIGEKANIALEYGAMFGTGGEQFQRMVLAFPETVIRDALERLAELFKSYENV